jgi:hypothetical protein
MGAKNTEYSDENNQKNWQTKALTYAASVNAYVEKGMRDGWKKAGKEPQDKSNIKLAQAALKAVREANKRGNTDALKELWPPMHHLLLPLIENNGQSISDLFLLNDGSFVARIGVVYELGRVVHVKGDLVKTVDGVKHIGRSPDRRYFAMAQDEGIDITDGFQGPVVCSCKWPTGLEGVPPGFDVKPLDKAPDPTQLIVFPDGQRILLVSSKGIFVLTSTQATRLLPTTEDMLEHFNWLKEQYPDDNDPASAGLAMDHGAVSPDGRWIAVGGQDTAHLIFNDKLEMVSEIGHHSEYPHFSFFSSDSTSVILATSTTGQPLQYKFATLRV